MFATRVVFLKVHARARHVGAFSNTDLVNRARASQDFKLQQVRPPFPFQYFQQMFLRHRAFDACKLSHNYKKSRVILLSNFR